MSSQKHKLTTKENNRNTIERKKTCTAKKTSEHQREAMESMDYIGKNAQQRNMKKLKDSKEKQKKTKGKQRTITHSKEAQQNQIDTKKSKGTRQENTGTQRKAMRRKQRQRHIQESREK